MPTLIGLSYVFCLGLGFRRERVDFVANGGLFWKGKSFCFPPKPPEKPSPGLPPHVRSDWPVKVGTGQLGLMYQLGTTAGLVPNQYKPVLQPGLSTGSLPSPI